MLCKSLGSHGFILLQYVALQVWVICALSCASYLKRTTYTDTEAFRSNRTTDYTCNKWVCFTVL